MSKSRSATPTRNTAPDTASPSQPSTSRPQPHENQSTPTVEEPDDPTHTLINSPQLESSTIPQRRPAASPLPEEPMAKQLRRMSPSSSRSGSSPGAPRDSPPPPPPPKKKRTRTLTTPHQSAVLHALLAQSRFPTTAMREEVGRAIGLSARKVQIWFQNQRQKARRPRSQGDTPLTRPPQYGAFPSIPESGASDYPAHVSQSYGQSSQYSASRDDVPQRTGPMGYHPDPYGRPYELPRLLGPGMPGPDFPVSSTYPGPSSAESGPVSAPVRPGHQGSSQESPTQGLFPTLASSSRSTGRPIDRDPSRILPPLPFHLPPSGRHVPPPLVTTFSHATTRSPSYSAPPTMPNFPSRRSQSPESPFAHRPPELPSRPIPPPFVLQPRPQWDNTMLRTAGSSHSVLESSWSRTGSPPPLSALSEHRQATPPTGDSVSARPTRPGRYDPVRGSVVPFSPSPSPPAPEERND